MTGFYVSALFALLMTTVRLDAGSVVGKVFDPSGAVVTGAAVTLLTSSKPIFTVTDQTGSYRFANVSAGNCRLRVVSSGFAPAELQLSVSAAGDVYREVHLDIAQQRDAISVDAEQQPGVNMENSLTTTVFRGKDLDALPDDPAALAAAVRALAGPSAGPEGSQIYVDGFLTNQIPSKQTIQEIRVNQNAFAAENDRPGFGNIQIITKPGADQLRGQAGVTVTHEQLNARNPFAANKPLYRYQLFDAVLSGPIRRGKSSFTLATQARRIDENAILNATSLDSAFNPVRISEAVVTPERLFGITSRVDAMWGPRQLVSARYQYDVDTFDNAGLGGISLPSRAYRQEISNHTVWLTDTITLSPTAIVEARARYQRSGTSKDSASNDPAVEVLGAFYGGGAQLGSSLINSGRVELQNYFTVTHQKHTLRFGWRLYTTSLMDRSPADFGGTYTFAGRVADDGTVLSSLDVYRRTLQLRSQGLSPAEVRALGGGATFLSIAAGDPTSSLRQVDGAAFFQDEVRLMPSLVLGFGLRYENQTNISSPANVAPRISFAWSPRAKQGQSGKTVFRGGFGMFYTRFGDNLALQAVRFNGATQHRYLVSTPELLDYFPLAPPLSALSNLTSQEMIRIIDPTLTAPYLMQEAISVERSFNRILGGSISYIQTRGVHQFRSVSVTPCLSACSDRVFSYQSSGVFKQRQLYVTAQVRRGNRLSLFLNYSLNQADSDTDGADSFPADPHNLRAEYGRALMDIRNRVMGAGSLTLPRGVILNPFVVFQSGAPFNITTGRDPYGDQLFTERPAFAPAGAPDAIPTRYGSFLLNAPTGSRMIPRNYGQSPSMFSSNLRVMKVIPLKPNPSPNPDSPYVLTLSVFGQNLFNTTNPGPPVGNLSSPLFGQSLGPNAGGFSIGSGRTSTSSRRIELQVRISF